MGDDLRALQLDRERASRQAALGQRAKAIAEGRLGPVLRRWINADVVPIAALLRTVASAYIAGDMALVAQLLDTPSAELSQRERPLRPLMEWVLRGRSPGRADTGDTSHAEDLVLAFMAVTLLRLARDERLTISAALALASDALRDTVQGQFITGIQGASAMQRVRDHHPEHWRQRKSLNRICQRLWAQAKPILEQEARGEREELAVRGGKKVLEVVDYSGELRRLEMRAPDPVDWEVMSLCWLDEKDSGTSPHRQLWLAFASVILAAAQRVGGWFEFASNRTGRKGHTRTTKYIVLSERAKEAIRKDVERWTSLGFQNQPMIVPPEGNDYLTVKHRPVTGQRPPMGLLTQPSGTSAWECGAAALAGSPWTINTHTLEILTADPSLWHPDDPSEAIRVAEHRRLASDTFYLPTVMDFRGRIYYRTPWVSPQSGDLGKALLCFPPPDKITRWGGGVERAVVMHMAGLYGGPRKVDKQALPERRVWFAEAVPQDDGADKPLCYKAAWALIDRGEWDRIPVQLDGTCNGLQHLAALTRDPDAARNVNLSPSTLDDPPADIYGTVAVAARSKLGALRGRAEWADRLLDAGVKLDRKLTKGPVMVLPYGGTLDAVAKAVKAATIEQLHASTQGRVEGTPWETAPGYEAFSGRKLDEHPLFNQDIRHLAGLVWDCITPAIPLAMAFMRTLQEIGSWVGERALAWSVGSSTGLHGDGGAGSPGTPRYGNTLSSTARRSAGRSSIEGFPIGMNDGIASAERSTQPLWIVQAKSQASRKQVTMRGFHLPDMVRRLTLMANRNEIDARAHRTGIVANFVHSLDAAHLAASVSRFKAEGGSCVGAVHDCLLVRPSEAALMGWCLREEFVRLHDENDPLLAPVKVGTPALAGSGVDGIEWKEYADWYELAAEAGVEFPERGAYEVEDVRRSAWFFS